MANEGAQTRRTTARGARHDGATAPRSSQITNTAVKKPALSPEERYRRIAEAAYRRAEARNFAPGGEIDDWLAAEREIDSDVTAAPSESGHERD